jgi:hypothetical protein
LMDHAMILFGILVFINIDYSLPTQSFVLSQPTSWWRKEVQFDKVMCIPQTRQSFSNDCQMKSKFSQ